MNSESPSSRSPWKKHGYKSGQVINESVKLIKPDFSGRREAVRCECLLCGEEYVAGHRDLRRGRRHQCSPWKKYGYKSGDVINETVKLVEPDFSKRQEAVRCECLLCGEEYISSHGDLRNGRRHRCSPWKKQGYKSGDVINETVKLVEPVFSKGQEAVRCECLLCGEEYVAVHGDLRKGKRHRCSPWKKHGYKSGDVINETVKLIKPDFSKGQEAVRCECLLCGEEYVAWHRDLRNGRRHKCSPWKKHGYKSGDVINETVKLVEPDFSKGAEAVRCECLLCGEEYVAIHGDLRNGRRHQCSPWKKQGYKSGQVINETVKLIEPDFSGVAE
jgi:hypothetical protein